MLLNISDCIDMKVCSTCKVNLDLSCFGKNRSKKDGLNTCCKICINFSDRKWYQENSDKKKARNKKWYQENSDKMKACNKKWYQENSDKKKARNKKYRHENSDKVKAKVAKRRSTKKQAKPPWYDEYDHNYITELYAIARHMTELMGEPYHVDHVHPLQNNLICGLHVSANWQILKGSKNLSKSNKFESYVWSECSFTNPWEV